MKRRKTDENKDSDKTRILPFSKSLSFIGKKSTWRGEQLVKKGKSLLLHLNNLVLPPIKCKSDVPGGHTNHFCLQRHQYKHKMSFADASVVNCYKAADLASQGQLVQSTSPLIMCCAVGER